MISQHKKKIIRQKELRENQKAAKQNGKMAGLWRANDHTPWMQITTKWTKLHKVQVSEDSYIIWNLLQIRSWVGSNSTSTTFVQPIDQAYMVCTCTHAGTHTHTVYTRANICWTVTSCLWSLLTVWVCSLTNPHKHNKVVVSDVEVTATGALIDTYFIIEGKTKWKLDVKNRMDIRVRHRFNNAFRVRSVVIWTII